MSATGSVATEQPQPMTPMRIGEGSCTCFRNSRTEVALSHWWGEKSTEECERVMLESFNFTYYNCTLVSLIPASRSSYPGKMKASGRFTRSSASRTAVSAPEELNRCEEEVISSMCKFRPCPELLSPSSVLTSPAVITNEAEW